MLVWMILPILSVLSCLKCPYTPWKRMILPTDRILSTVWHFIGCLYEWSRKSCQSLVCYTASHVLIHLENEWSYPLIEFHRPYGISYVIIGCLYEWSRKSCQSLVCYTAHMSLYKLKKNDLTHWSNCIDRMAYYMYLLDACVNDLVSIVNP